MLNNMKKEHITHVSSPPPTIAHLSSFDTTVTGESRRDDEDYWLVIKHVRLLIAELCQQFDGGHPGYEFRTANFIHLIYDGCHAEIL